MGCKPARPLTGRIYVVEVLMLVAALGLRRRSLVQKREGRLRREIPFLQVGEEVLMFVCCLG